MDQWKFWVGFEDTNVKLRATVKRDVRRNMTVQSVWGVQIFRGIYGIHPTIGRGCARGCWDDDILGPVRIEY